MDSISDLLSADPLRSFSKKADKVEVTQRFSELVGSSPHDRIVGTLSAFVGEKPFRYWDKAQVIATLKLLEADVNRSIRAVAERSSAIDRGLAALYRQSPTASLDESLSLNHPRDLIKIASTYMPDYLRWSEHVFGNILELYWAILKKGDVKGSFNLKGASARIKSQGKDFLLQGYLEEVRNAIAHGEISISPFEIEFGVTRPEKMTASDFLRLYDNLIRTCNALAISMFIFWSKHHTQHERSSSLPINLLARLAAGGFDRQGLRLIGAIESDTPLAGKQLHVAIEISLRKRTQVMGECARVAYHLLSVGANGYDRYVIQVDQGEAVGSMVTVDPSALEMLISEDAPFERLSEALGDGNLLWFDEGTWATRLKSWKEIASSGVRWLRIDILQTWHEAGIFRGKGRYDIRDVENLSTQGIARVRIRVVLRNPDHAEDDEVVRAVLSDVVSNFRRKLIRSKSRLLDPGIPMPKFPSYIWVDLYKEDGTLRWLKSGGWMSGNLVAMAEFVRGSNPPIQIEEPEEIHKGIRIRYSMNMRRAAKALSDFKDLFEEIQRKRGNGENT